MCIKTSAATFYNWNNIFPFAICRLVSTAIKSKWYLGVSLIIVWEIKNSSQVYKLFNTFQDQYWWQSKPTKNLGCHTVHNSHLYIKTRNTDSHLSTSSQAVLDTFRDNWTPKRLFSSYISNICIDCQMNRIQGIYNKVFSYLSYKCQD